MGLPSLPGMWVILNGAGLVIKKQEMISWSPRCNTDTCLQVGQVFKQ